MNLDYLTRNEFHAGNLLASDPSFAFSTTAVSTDLSFQIFPKDAIERSLPNRFDAIAARFPDRLAVADAHGELTYQELRQLVLGLAREFHEKLPPGDAPVAIFLDRDRLFIAAMLGVLRAGRAYVPLDAGFPAERNRRILKIAGACAIATTPDLRTMASNLAGPEIPIFRVDASSITTSVCDEPSDLPPHPSPDDVASIIFTSGSTGAPKGVFQSHRNLLFEAALHCNYLRVTPKDRLSLLYSPSVMGAVRDIYGALLTGASVHIGVPAKLGPAGLRRFLDDQGITIYHSVPSVLRQITSVMDTDQRFHSVRAAYFSGDRLHSSDIAAFRRHLSRQAIIYTGIGSTEVSCLYTHWFIEHHTPIEDGLVPAGYEIPGRRVVLLDDDGVPVSDGGIGEMVIVSKFLSQGYWRDPERTAEKFPVDPQGGGCRRYHTGDLGRRGPGGLLHFMGRKDDQISLRGHRIEPIEIEAAMETHPGVESAAVVLHGTPPQEILVAFWTASSNHTDAESLRTHLQTLLPNHMIPAKFVRLDEIPRLPGHKIDRAALRHRPAALPPAPSHPPDPALTPALTPAVMDIFQRVLHCKIRSHDRYDQLGGDSLAAVQIALELQHMLGRRVPENLLAVAATPRAVAKWAELTARGEGNQLLPINPRPHPGTYAERPYLMIMSEINGGVSALGMLGHVTAPESSLAGYNMIGVVDRVMAVPAPPTDNMSRIAEETIEAMQRGGIPEPFRLIGFSFAGRLAYEVAYQLLAAGRRVGFLGLVDTPSRPLPWVAKTLAQAPKDSDRILHARMRASASYVIPRLNAPLTLFRGADGWPEEPLDYGWSEFAPRTTVISVPGKHDTLHLPPFRRSLAAAIRRAVESADQG